VLGDVTSNPKRHAPHRTDLRLEVARAHASGCSPAVRASCRSPMRTSGCSSSRSRHSAATLDIPAACRHEFERDLIRECTHVGSIVRRSRRTARSPEDRRPRPRRCGSCASGKSWSEIADTTRCTTFAMALGRAESRRQPSVSAISDQDLPRLRSFRTARATGRRSSGDRAVTPRAGATIEPDVSALADQVALELGDARRRMSSVAALWRLLEDEQPLYASESDKTHERLASNPMRGRELLRGRKSVLCGAWPFGIRGHIAEHRGCFVRSCAIKNAKKPDQKRVLRSRRVASFDSKLAPACS